MGAQAINVAARMPRRVAYFDVLNILATISVVWIHFGNEVHWYDGSKVWYWCLFIQVVCYWAVPVFFMLTGATLNELSGKVFYKRVLSPPSKAQPPSVLSIRGDIGFVSGLQRRFGR